MKCDSPDFYRYLFNDAEVKPFDPSQIASECFGGEVTVSFIGKRFFSPKKLVTTSLFDLRAMPISCFDMFILCFTACHLIYLIVYFQSKTYDSVTDKFMDFSFEKVLRK